MTEIAKRFNTTPGKLVSAADQRESELAEICREKESVFFEALGHGAMFCESATMGNGVVLTPRVAAILAPFLLHGLSQMVLKMGQSDA